MLNNFNKNNFFINHQNFIHKISLFIQEKLRDSSKYSKASIFVPNQIFAINLKKILKSQNLAQYNNINIYLSTGTTDISNSFEYKLYDTNQKFNDISKILFKEKLIIIISKFITIKTQGSLQKKAINIVNISNAIFNFLYDLFQTSNNFRADLNKLSNYSLNIPINLKQEVTLELIKLIAQNWQEISHNYSDVFSFQEYIIKERKKYFSNSLNTQNNLIIFIAHNSNLKIIKESAKFFYESNAAFVIIPNILNKYQYYQDILFNNKEDFNIKEIFKLNNNILYKYNIHNIDNFRNSQLPIEKDIKLNSNKDINYDFKEYFIDNLSLFLSDIKSENLSNSIQNKFANIANLLSNYIYIKETDSIYSEAKYITKFINHFIEKDSSQKKSIIIINNDPNILAALEANLTVIDFLLEKQPCLYIPYKENQFYPQQNIAEFLIEIHKFSINFLNDNNLSLLYFLSFLKRKEFIFSSNYSDYLQFLEIDIIRNFNIDNFYELQNIILQKIENIDPNSQNYNFKNYKLEKITEFLQLIDYNLIDPLLALKRNFNETSSLNKTIQNLTNFITNLLQSNIIQTDISNSTSNVTASYQLYQQIIKFINNSLNSYNITPNKDNNTIFTDLIDYSNFIIKNIKLHTQYKAIFKHKYYNVNIEILAPNEANFLHADIIIIPNLNKGVFPSRKNNDLCINNYIQKTFNINTSCEQRNLEIEYFCNYFLTPKILLTRATNINELATEESFLLKKLKKLLSYYNYTEYSQNIAPLKKISYNSKYIDNNFTKSKRPNPKVTLEHRPRKLYSTNIENLLTNPYGFYAKKILNLYKTGSIIKDFSNFDLGNIVHETNEIFFNNFNEYIKSIDTENEKKIIEVLRKKYMFIATAIIYKYNINPIYIDLFKVSLDNISKKLVEKTYDKYLNSSQDIKFLNEKILSKRFFIPSDNFQNFIKDYNPNKPFSEDFLTEPKNYNNKNYLQYTISSKIDKISLEGSQISITDYKTGTIPNIKDIILGFKSQLQIATILIILKPDNISEEFKNLNKNYFSINNNINCLEIFKHCKYEHLKPIRIDELKDLDLIDKVAFNELIINSYNGLIKLLHYYSDSNYGYLAPNPNSHFSSNNYNDYQHLAREFDWK